MDWYPWYYTIYELDTMHLSPYQDGCYRRLIDHYMKTRAPLPDNDAALARIIGDSLDNWTTLASSEIRKFFIPKNGNLHLRRCDEILSYQDAKTKKLSESGKKGAKIRHLQAIENNDVSSHPKATLKPPLGVAVAQVHVQVDNIDKSILPPIVPQGDVLPGWMPVDAWNGYCKHRGKKFTENAKRLAIKKLELWQAEGIDISEVLNNSVMNGWTGLFKTKEVKNETSGRVLTKHERLQLAAAKAVEQLSGQEPQSAISGPDKPKLRGF